MRRPWSATRTQKGQHSRHRVGTSGLKVDEEEVIEVTPGEHIVLHVTCRLGLELPGWGAHVGRVTDLSGGMAWGSSLRDVEATQCKDRDKLHERHGLIPEQYRHRAFALTPRRNLAESCWG